MNQTRIYHSSTCVQAFMNRIIDQSNENWKRSKASSFYMLLYICQALTDYAISCRIRPSKMINDKYPITLVIAFDQHIIVNGSLYNLTAIQRIMTFE